MNDFQWYGIAEKTVKKEMSNLPDSWSVATEERERTLRWDHAINIFITEKGKGGNIMAADETV